jgi:Alkylmercury lyase
LDHHDLEIRQRTYADFAEFGRPPVSDELGDGFKIRAAWGRLHDEHALVIDQQGELRMAPPFSAVPTPFRVEADDRSWYANCAWDAVGICAALGTDGLIETVCPDCGEPIELQIVDRKPADQSLVFHCLVPARQWWDDIVFT